MDILLEVSKAGDISALYAVLGQDSEILEKIDAQPLVDSPLHIAASAGCTHFALEIMRLKPSFGKKLNPQGLSPLHLALLNRHTSTVKRLIKYDPELVRVQGREGLTPLHYLVADESGEDIDLLADFLVKCPASIRYTTIRGETALHLAVKNRKVEAFKVLHGWLRRTDNYGVLNWGANDYDGVLNWKDENGNAALHLAVCTNQPKILKLLITKDYKNDKNLEGKTALDIAMEFPEQEENEQVRNILIHAHAAKGSSVPTPLTLAAFLGSKSFLYQEVFMKMDFYLDKGLSGEMRNALLVVAVLIATATYQALLQPPGGISQSGDQNPLSSLILNGTYIINGTTIHNNATISSSSIDHASQAAGHGAGKVLMPARDFNIFFALNSIAFSASLGIIYTLLPIKLGLLMYTPLVFMLLCYIISGEFISPASPIRTIVLVLSYAVFLFIITISKSWVTLIGPDKHLYLIIRSIIDCKSSQNSRGR